MEAPVAAAATTAATVATALATAATVATRVLAALTAAAAVVVATAVADRLTPQNKLLKDVLVLENCWERGV